jgi:hypothetical protein
VASRYRWCEPSTSGQDVHRPERHRAGVACGLQSLGGSRPAPPLHERASRGDGRCGGRGGSSRSRVRRPCADGLVAYRGLEVRGQTLWVESSSRGWRRFYDGSTACIIAYGVVTFAVSGIARSAGRSPSFCSSVSYRPPCSGSPTRSTWALTRPQRVTGGAGTARSQQRIGLPRRPTLLRRGGHWRPSEETLCPEPHRRCSPSPPSRPVSACWPPRLSGRSDFPRCSPA